MSMARRFHGKPVTRLIVSVPDDVVVAVDRLLKLSRNHPAKGNRAEFVRIAVAEKLARDSAASDDFCAPPRARATDEGSH